MKINPNDPEIRARSLMGLLVKHEDGWWITELECEDCGPYDTLAEATEDMRRLRKFFKHEHDAEFILGSKEDRCNSKLTN